MATRTDNAVTLTHEQAERVRSMLADYASGKLSLSQRTRSAVVREQCQRNAREARDMAAMLVRSMFTWLE